jgi:hypothetical protein
VEVEAAGVVEAVAELGTVAGPDKQNAAGRIIDRLIEKRRIGTAIAFATTLLNAGDEWAEAWIPRPPLARIGGREVTHRQLLIAKAVTNIRELLAATADGQVRSTTVSIADTDYAAYCDLRLALIAPDRAELAVACWTVYTDTARYFGDNPPTEAERKLQPDGTAITDLAETVRVIDDLAYELKARDLPTPHAGGRHLAITIPTR